MSSFSDATELDVSSPYLPGDDLADVFDGRDIFIVVLQRVVGMRIGGDDSLHSRRLDRLGVVIAQGQEQHLFAKSPDFVAAVFLGSAQDSEVFSDVVENPGGGASDRLHAVVVGSNAVDEIKGVGAVLSVENLDGAGLAGTLAP